MSKIERAKRFFDNLQELGYDANVAVPQLSTIKNFEEENNRLQIQHSGLIDDCSQKQQELSHLQTETSKAEAALADVNGQKSKAANELSEILQKVKHESSRIEFAEALCLLFGDISKITPSQLVELSAQLQVTAGAMLRLERPLLTDYTMVRETALLLLEQVLGKSLVPREVFDNLIHRVIEMHDDKMFDTLTKAEKDLEESLKMSRETLELTWDKALTAALSFQKRGKLGIYECLACGSTIAVKVVGQRSQPLLCPLCGAVSSFSRLKLTEQDKA